MKRLLVLLMVAGAFVVIAESKPAQAAKKKTAKKTAAKRNKKSSIKSHYSSFLNQLPTAERKKLEQLYRSNPKAFQREIRAKIAHWKKQQVVRESKETYSLIRLYQRERDPKKKTELKKKLTELTRKQFMKRINENKYRIRKMEKVLKDLKVKNANREKNADKIIEERVRYLTTDPSLRW